MFHSTLDSIRRSAERIDNNEVNNIPFSTLPTLNKHVPGIIKGMYYIVTASSGVGKTQFTKRFFVLEPYMYMKAHPEKNIKLKILYFALEESKEEFMLGLISNRLYTEYGVEISVLDLQSFDTRIDPQIVKLIEECEEYFSDFEKSVEVIDNIYNPTGIYKYVQNYADANGSKQYKTIDIDGKETKVFSHYEPNDPNEFVIVITDHISLLQEERDPTTHMVLNKHQTISKWSADYCRKQISKHYKYAVVNVQQQVADKEKQEFYRGVSIESKLEPSLDGLADNKLTQRDALVIIGLFAPDRYEINKHLGYDVKILKDNYRSIKILKNRLGRPNLKKGLYFDGKVNDFKELPNKESNEIQKLYETKLTNKN